MTGKGHIQVGIGCSISAFYFSFEYLFDNNPIMAAITAFFVIVGSKAPDFLEIQKSNGNTVIPHRTITHWSPIWLYLLFLGLSETQGYGSPEYLNQPLSALLIGLSIGSLSHIITDLPNPMGVPFLTPWHRISLNLWKSGRFESIIIGLFYSLSIGLILLDLELITLNL